eukprot:gnl/MRDRNA2_/MRDRNA2_129543_c0_seq1.p1 gnl/MRDRNA2_/MRDRNA2_129543_c0~~gnl/MRDRNA2_/MRDRNA2_129543_c0_seq1.p1  ORF type:complete len:434 (-),score=38.28 gnl/MRDRNA2_/MRDRNA2_129543_c0_seq1:57-1358(-)
MVQRSPGKQLFPLRTTSETNALHKKKPGSSNTGAMRVRIVSLRVSNLHELTSGTLRKLQVVLSLGDSQAFRTAMIESSTGVYCWAVPARFNDRAVCSFSAKGLTNLVHSGAPLVLDIFLSEFQETGRPGVPAECVSCQRLGSFSLDLKPMKYHQEGNLAVFESTNFSSDVTFGCARVPQVVLEAAWSSQIRNPQRVACIQRRRDLWPEGIKPDIATCKPQEQVTQTSESQEIIEMTDQRDSSHQQHPASNECEQPQQQQLILGDNNPNKSATAVLKHPCHDANDEGSDDDGDGSSWVERPAFSRRRMALRQSNISQREIYNWSWSTINNRLTFWACSSLPSHSFRFVNRRMTWWKSEVKLPECNDTLQHVVPSSEKEQGEDQAKSLSRTDSWYWSCQSRFSYFTRTRLDPKAFHYEGQRMSWCGDDKLEREAR